MSCTTSPAYRWYQRGVVGCTLVGGLLLMLAAAIVHDSAAIAPLAIGGAWTAIGAAGLSSLRRIAYELRLDDGQVIFVFPGRELRMPAGDVLAVQPSRLGTSRRRMLRVRTTSHGVVKVNRRLTGLFDFLLALRQANPDVAVGDL